MIPISMVLAQASGAPSQPDTAWWESPAFWAAVVAAAAALVSAGLTSWAARRQRAQQVALATSQREHEMRLNEIANRFSQRQQLIEFSKQQLNELYGPLYMLRQASHSLRTLLPSSKPDGTRWRLVDHIADVQRDTDTELRTAVEEILNINGQIEELLVTKAGLFEAFPPPDSFKVFTAHARLLKLSWEQGRNQTETHRIPFPDQIDADIDNAIQAIRDRLNKLTEAAR